MKINDVEFYLAEIERADSRQPVRSLLVRLVTNSGLEGWGETSLGWRVAELPLRRKALLPVLAGRNAFDVEELLQLETLAPAPLRSAVEMACWDLVGRAVRQPVAHLWGGAYRQHVPLAVRLDGDRPERVAEVARSMADQGFHTQVFTSRGRADDDLRTLSAVREAVGERVTLRLDGAEQYDLENARDLCAGMEYEAPEFLLDPLNTRELYALASLGRQTSVPLGAWRSIRGPADALAAVRCSAAPFLVVDIEQVGGLTTARKCAAVVEAGGVRALVGGGASTGVAAAAMLQLAASTPVFACPNECVLHQLRDHLLVEPLEVVDGMATVPQGPGLGVEVDRAKLERYQLT